MLTFRYDCCYCNIMTGNYIQIIICITKSKIISGLYFLSKHSVLMWHDSLEWLCINYKYYLTASRHKTSSELIISEQQIFVECFYLTLYMYKWANMLKNCWPVYFVKHADFNKRLRCMYAKSTVWQYLHYHWLPLPNTRLHYNYSVDNG